MKIIIQSPDFKATKRLQKFVDKNVSKLGVFYDRIVESRVCLKTDNSDKSENKVCELQVVIPGNDLFASKKGATFEDAVMKAVDAVKHQVERIRTVRELQRAG